MKNSEPTENGQLGEIVIEKELLNSRQLAHCLEISKEQGSGDLGEVMVVAGYLTPEQMTAVRAEARRRKCRIPGFEILEKVGAGSYGTVYRARQMAMERDVALKVLHPELSQNMAVVKKYISEARAVAKLNHPHIVQGIDVGACDGYYYFAMEFLSGGTLSESLDAGACMSESEAKLYLYQVAQALDHAWQQKIIHCDLKPDNLMLNEAGRLKLTDLGLAQVGTAVESAAGGKKVVRGTPHYISPEQIETPDDLDCRCDLYSLGATFFHLLSGVTPFNGENKKEIMLARLKQDAPELKSLRKEISPDFSRLIGSLLAKDRTQRPQSPAELSRKLIELGVDPKAAGDHLSAVGVARKSSSTTVRKRKSTQVKRTPARRATSSTKLKENMKKNVLWWLIAGVVVLGLLFCAVVWKIVMEMT
jgi:serine/threonine-protein kinase